MTIRSTMRSGFAAICAAAPEAVVDVVSGGVTADGMRCMENGQAALSGMGMEEGVTRAAVRVSAGDMSKPALGATITVDGEDVIVTDARADLMGALITIEYQQVRKVEGL